VGSQSEQKSHLLGEDKRLPERYWAFSASCFLPKLTAHPFQASRGEVSSYTECGQELWQIACQWVWNLRLALGQQMQGGMVREMEWAPPKEAPPVFVAVENPSEEYGPWQWATPFGRATGRLGAEAFSLQENGMLRCPAGASLWLSEIRQENTYTQRAVYVASQTDCPQCALREHCLGRKAKGNRARRVSAVRRLLPPTRICGAKSSSSGSNTMDRCGWSSPSPYVDGPLAQAIRRDPSAT